MPCAFFSHVLLTEGTRKISKHLLGMSNRKKQFLYVNVFVMQDSLKFGAHVGAFLAGPNGSTGCVPTELRAFPHAHSVLTTSSHRGLTPGGPEPRARKNLTTGHWAMTSETNRPPPGCSMCTYMYIRVCTCVCVDEHIHIQTFHFPAAHPPYSPAQSTE